MTPWLGVEGGIVDGGGLPEGLNSACEGWFPSTQTAPAILAENVTRSPRDIDFGLPPCVPRIWPGSQRRHLTQPSILTPPYRLQRPPSPSSPSLRVGWVLFHFHHGVCPTRTADGRSPPPHHVSFYPEAATPNCGIAPPTPPRGCAPPCWRAARVGEPRPRRPARLVAPPAHGCGAAPVGYPRRCVGDVIPSLPASRERPRRTTGGCCTRADAASRLGGGARGAAAPPRRCGGGRHCPRVGRLVRRPGGSR
ncbi:hypothetical protein BU14_1781s0002 [Porphyra umbilicalis]|uniref:Uncharacterized protein n=1 Tax=Porphyra umbilicalis TaxID=2786 RepID=A0A1X6NLE9_PORUM|nr:hypothetical protein BU14_1781s0002 [Porphyra umbilicalis]|eukprot:OSX69163.1 hypothetical protein BU14_1781s0002 [Porphyra umbilicalis]